MLRLVDVIERETDSVTFQTTELVADDLVTYVVYDTSTGVANMEDYYGWRTTTTADDDGESVEFSIDDSTKYPSYISSLTDYSILRPALFRVMTLHEYLILDDVLTRLDLVRRRLPNPGFGVSSTNDVGQNGTVTFAGGFEKKMTVGEIMRMMEGTIVELNSTSPQTSFWPMYSNMDNDKVSNPYRQQGGIPYDMRDLVVLGTMIRCLMALGILEVDLSFSSSDSGLQITFDRASHVKGWHDALLQEYKESKAQFKWNHANHAGVGVGTTPWAAYGIWGTLMNNVSNGGQLALNSVLGFNASGNVPM